MDAYEASKSYWERVFEQPRRYDPREPLPYPEIEAGLTWLSRPGARLLDFGSGSGRALLRCLTLGAGSGAGIDLSRAAVQIGFWAAEHYRLSERATFTQGSIKQLAKLPSCSFDGAILFNILDNLLPEDAGMVMHEVGRLLGPRGRVLVKLNSYRPQVLFEQDQEYIPLGQGLYQESSGLFFWNLSEDQLAGLIAGRFDLEREVEVPFPEYNTVNRMYYLVRAD